MTPLKLTPSGYLSFLDALIFVLVRLHAAEIKALKSKKHSRKLIDESTKQTGRRFPDGFVAHSLCDPQRVPDKLFTSIELFPDFRDLSRKACFHFIELLRSGILAPECDSLFTHSEFSKFYKPDRSDIFARDTEEFYEQYIEPRGSLTA